MYAEVDNWVWNGSLEDPSKKLENALDIWVVSRLHQLQTQITRDMDAYNLPDALSGIIPFLDDASNWYVRRSRRRFWKSDDDADKHQAYTTLHYVLTKLALLLAPFTPFLAEELYHNMTGQDSVHLADWPKQGEVDEEVLSAMARTRRVIEQGLALRMAKSETENQVKVRQPLSLLQYGGSRLASLYEAIISEEVNVKNVRNNEGRDGEVQLDKTITPELRREGLMREVVRNVQAARKQAGLQVDDRIVLSLASSDNELLQAIEEHSDAICTETLATSMSDVEDGYLMETKIETADLRISLKKDSRA